MSSVLKVDRIQSDTGTVNVASKIEFPVGSAAAPSIFPTGDTNTGIFFPAADTIAFAEGGAEAMRIDSSGNVGVRSSGTTTPTYDFSTLGEGLWSRYWDSSGNRFADLVAIANTPAGATMAMRFFTNTGSAPGTAVERARITSGGALLIGKTTVDDTVVGVKLGTGLGDNAFTVGTVSGTGAYWGIMINRQDTDGSLITFRQANTDEGTISVSGNTVSYNQFLGSHWAALTDWSKPDIKIGTILDSINELVIWKFAVIDVNGEQKKICYNGNAAAGTTVSVEYEGETYQGVVELEREREFTKAVKVKVNDTAASKAVYGVFVGWNNDINGDGGVWNDMYVGAVGNYVVRMAAGQEPEIGDLIEADGNGCGVVQDDDIVRTKTVGKITSNIIQKTYEDGSFLVTCVLYSG